jgi:hypothetical protein
MVLAAAFTSRHQRDDDVGTDRAHQPHVVRGNFVAAPLLERLFEAEREPEVHRAREVLFGAVESVQRLELFRSQHAKCLENLWADFVLPAIAARRRRQCRAIPLAAVHHHQQPVVLIVWMRRGLHQDAGVGEMPQREPERHMSAFGVNGDDAELGSRDVG